MCGDAEESILKASSFHLKFPSLFLGVVFKPQGRNPHFLWPFFEKKISEKFQHFCRRKKRSWTLLNTTKVERRVSGNMAAKHPNLKRKLCKYSIFLHPHRAATVAYFSYGKDEKVSSFLRLLSYIEKRYFGYRVALKEEGGGSVIAGIVERESSKRELLRPERKKKEEKALDTNEIRRLGVQCKGDHQVIKPQYHNRQDLALDNGTAVTTINFRVSKGPLVWGPLLFFFPIQRHGAEEEERESSLALQSLSLFPTKHLCYLQPPFWAQMQTNTATIPLQ